ncbi:di-trans,poly-cis-decaprenylcistransferase [Buchnera aphidicola (Hormaphis cornu)]|nr:di-trans,poly-cis-decaprenylcistransferase [Buchnera aphidicola (Hormaphis cornu)]
MSVVNKIENNKKYLCSKNMLRHVAIIMDGNGRWAKNQGKLRIEGHREGIRAVIKSIEFAVLNKIEVLTLFAFSSENKIRPVLEVISLMDLFLNVLDTHLEYLKVNNIRLRVIGDKSFFNKTLQDKINESEKRTKNNSGLTLNIAANYGGRWDIIEAIKKIIKKVQLGTLNPEEINDITVSKLLCMNDLPAVDLVIRTGSEFRISNFLIWQITYAELYFTDVLWPDFDNQIFQSAVDFFLYRKRRYGGL